MLPRLHRLASRSDHARLRKSGRAYGSSHVVITAGLQGTETYGLAPTRIGVVVSRRVGKAVTRNRVRRQLREIARSFMPTLAQGFDLTIGARPSAATATFQSLTDAVRSGFQRGRLISSMGVDRQAQS